MLFKPVPSTLTRSLHHSLLFLGLGLIGGEAVLAFALVDGRAEGAAFTWAFSAAGWLYVLCGCLAWWRRPSNAMGLLIVAGGVVLMLSVVGSFPSLTALGAVTATLVLAVMVHLLLAFPSGRLRSRPARVVAIAGYVVSLVLQIPLYAFDPASAGLVVFIAPRPDLVDLGRTVQEVAGVLVVVATVVILAGRLARATSWQRKVLIPLFTYGMLAVLFIPVSAQLLPVWLGWSPTQVGIAQLIGVAGVPVAFLLAVLTGGFARTGEVQELAGWLSSPVDGRPGVSAALARVLGDPQLQVVFRVPGREDYVDAQGTAAELPDGAATRSTVPIELGGEVIGAVVYDSELIADEELVRAAGRLVSLGVERERLTAALLASQQSLRRSRERLVETADRERRRIAQDLHDGLQVTLVLLAIEAQQLANLPGTDPEHRQRAIELRHGIDTAAAELRSLVHAVMPSALLERGLGLAADDLVDRLPVPADLHVGRIEPLPAPIASSAYFVVAEALTNVVKHAQATRVTVRLDIVDEALSVEVCDDGRGGAHVDLGTGLRGLADRVDVLGGTFRLTSPAGGGTTVAVRFPVQPATPEEPATTPATSASRPAMQDA